MERAVTHDERIMRLYRISEDLQRIHADLEGEPAKLVRDAAAKVFAAIAKIVGERACEGAVS